MRGHRYPGLFGDPRSPGIGAALAASVVLHAALLAAFGRLPTPRGEHRFYAPLHMVELAPAPATPAQPPARAAAPSRGSPPAAKPKPPAAPQPKAAPPKAPAKPKERAAKTPAKPPSAVEAGVPAPSTEPGARHAVSAAPPEQGEQRVAERIARLREKMGASAPRAPAAGAGEEAVRQRIDALRERLGSPGARRGANQPAVGVRRAGGSVLQEVRLRAYYNQLWDHVTAHWAIPPPLKGKSYTAIVSVVIDRRGEILRAWVEEPSGSEAFDRAALAALKRAEPLPPIPEALSDDVLEVGFRFHPE
ncbi:MAG: hypothetical protein Kow0092_34580 [Deferrisomatales bacterium]